jgi:hypothetical protein
MAETIEYVAADGASVTIYRRQGGSGRFMPPVLVDDRPVPGDHGTRFRGCRFDAAQPIIPHLIEGASDAEARAALRALSSVLNPAKGVGTLRATVDGNVREQSALYIEGLGDWTEDEPWLAMPNLMFRAFDPFWYDSTTVAGTFATGDVASFFPIFPWRLASSEVFADATVVNDGDVEAWPQWTITGPGTGLVLRNLTTGKSLALDYELVAGAVVTVDTSPGVKTVTLDDGTNLFGNLTARQLWPIVRGSNSVRVELAGATSDTEVAMTFRRRWLSA